MNPTHASGESSTSPRGAGEEVELGGFPRDQDSKSTSPGDNGTMDFVSEASVAKGFQQNNDLEANSLSGGSGHGSATTSSSNNAQAGVKNIEAVVMTWTEWRLIAAYLRYVESLATHVECQINNFSQYLLDGIHRVSRAANCAVTLGLCY